MPSPLKQRGIYQLPAPARPVPKSHYAQLLTKRHQPPDPPQLDPTSFSGSPGQGRERMWPLVVKQPLPKKLLQSRSQAIHSYRINSFLFKMTHCLVSTARFEAPGRSARKIQRFVFEMSSRKSDTFQGLSNRDRELLTQPQSDDKILNQKLSFDLRKAQTGSISCTFPALVSSCRC